MFFKLLISQLFLRLFFNSLATTALLVSFIPEAKAARIFAETEGKLEATPVEMNSLLEDSTGLVCATSSVDNKFNEITIPSEESRMPPRESCQILLKRKNAQGKITSLPIAGFGAEKNKFIVEKDSENNIISYDSDQSTASSQTIEPDDGVKTNAKGDATWVSEQGTKGAGDNTQFFRSTISAKTEIIKDEPKEKAPGGFAGAEGKDPFLFDFETTGSLEYIFSLKDLKFFSDDPNGVLHLDASSKLSNVTLNGNPLNDFLFALTFDAKGIINSSSDIDVNFVPWTGLGLNPSDVKSIENFITSSLVDLGMGNIGFNPDSEFFLFGPNGLIDTLIFEHGEGEVIVEASVISVIQTPSISEPDSTFSLVALGIFSIFPAFKGIIEIQKR